MGRAVVPRTLLALLLACLLAAACGDERPGGEDPGRGEGPPGAEGSRPGGTAPARMMDVTVHFTGADEETVPVGRRVPVPAGAPRPPGPADSLRAALRALLAGPTDREVRRGLASFFSPEATGGVLRSVELVDGRAVIDFRDLSSVLPNASSSAGSRELLDQLGATVLQFGGVREAEYRMEGSCERFWNWLQRPCRIVREVDAPEPARPRES